MPSSLLDSLNAGDELSSIQVDELCRILLNEEEENHLKSSLLKALAAKGETVEEITAFASSVLKQAKKVNLTASLGDAPSIDICGTGGDRLNLFNVSTTAMFVIAAGGAKVIKHGNRGVTSLSGSSDVLSQLGIPLHLPDSTLQSCLAEANVCFLYAPAYHPAFKAVATVRQTLAKEGVHTIFNLIGPLLNPAQPTYQMVGVAHPQRTKDFATILHNLGRKQAYAVTGFTADHAPVDECSTMGSTSLYSMNQEHSEAVFQRIESSDLGIPQASLPELQGGSPKENAQTLHDILAGTITGAKRDIVILNAAAGLTCCQITSTLTDGVSLAKELIDSGKALQKLHALQRIFS